LLFNFSLIQSFVFEFVLEGCALDLDGSLLLMEDEFWVWFAHLWLVIVVISGLKVALPVLEGAEVAHDVSVCA
jgi:hypothetical protein